jgi:hypothetical protein
MSLSGVKQTSLNSAKAWAAEPQRSLRCHFAFMSASAGYPRFFKASSTPSISRSWILRLSLKAASRSASYSAAARMLYVRRVQWLTGFVGALPSLAGKVQRTSKYWIRSRAGDRVGAILTALVQLPQEISEYNIVTESPTGL